MTDPASAPGPRPSPTVGAGAVCVVVLAVAGLVFGRPDAVALAVPLLRARSLLHDRFVGRFGTYLVRYESLNFDSIYGVHVTAPDGRKLAAYLNSRTLEVLPC